MKIEILGTGCPKCKQLEANARQAVEEAGKEAKFSKVTDINDIMSYNVMATPAIVVDGEVRSSGKLVEVEEIKKWL